MECRIDDLVSNYKARSLKFVGYLSEVYWEYPRQAASFDDGPRDERSDRYVGM